MTLVVRMLESVGVGKGKTRVRIPNSSTPIRARRTVTFRIASVGICSSTSGGWSKKTRSSMTSKSVSKESRLRGGDGRHPNVFFEFAVDEIGVDASLELKAKELGVTGVSDDASDR